MSKTILRNIYTALLVLLLIVLVLADGESGQSKSEETEKDVKSTKAPSTDSTDAPMTNISVTLKNTTASSNGTRFMDGGPLSILENKGMLMRSFYVLLGLTSLVIIYFGVKAWRTRRRRNKSRKYGLITSRDADLEMEPLDRDMDDDDDMTVFEVNGRQK